MIRKSSPPRLSPKRLKALGGKPQFSTIKKRPRPKAETERIYGPPARRKWIKTLPCSACGVVGYSENAHVAPPSEKGTGYKAGYRWIVPLCGPRGSQESIGTLKYYIGCHTLFDRYRDVFDRKFPDFDPARAAAETEKLWLAHQEAMK